MLSCVPLYMHHTLSFEISSTELVLNFFKHINWCPVYVSMLDFRAWVWNSLPGPELGNASYICCEKVLDHRVELSFQPNGKGTEWDWKGWGNASSIMKMAGVWMWCNSHYFGIKTASVEGDTSEGPCSWCIRPGFGHQSFWRYVYMAVTQESSGYLWKSMFGYQEQRDCCREVFGLMCWICTAAVLQGSVELKTEKT